MTLKTIATLTTCTLLLSFPLLAQEPAQEEPTPQSAQDQVTEPAPEDSTQATESQSASAEMQASDEEVELSASSDDGTQVSAEIDTGDSQADQPQEDRELPQTASPLAFLALLGLAGMGSAAAVRVSRRK